MKLFFSFYMLSLVFHSFAITNKHNYQITYGVPCGLSGSFEERIKSCQPHTIIYGDVNLYKSRPYKLLTRTKEGFEVYLDPKSETWQGARVDTLWTSSLPSQLSQSDAINSCQNKELLSELTGLEGINWYLPSSLEFNIMSTNRSLLNAFSLNGFNQDLFWTRDPRIGLGFAGESHLIYNLGKSNENSDRSHFSDVHVSYKTEKLNVVCTFQLDE